MLQEKSRDITKLREEVERLSGEVEVLRGVVEEGLKERREVKEREHSSAGTSNTSKEDRSIREQVYEEPPEREFVVEDADSSSSSKATEQNTSNHVGPFIDADELDRISLEVEERRSERSISRSVGSTARLPDNPSQPVPSPHSHVEGSPLADNPELLQVPTQVIERSQPHPPRTTPWAAQNSSCRSEKKMSEARPATQAPFPDIRGSRVEGLFLAAPQHDMHTCSLCHKRRRPHSALSSIPNINSEHFGQERKRVSATKEPLRQDGDAQHGSEETDRLPPQTVLARVLRELEDDFTHYKA